MADAAAEADAAEVVAAVVPKPMSPDGKHAVFIRDYNLWARDVASGQETQLTKDGVKDFGYATDNAGWQSSDRPIVVWSPDSKKIATYQQDQRKVGEMYLVDTKVGHPTLRAWKYPLPGDDVVTMIQPVIIDVAANQDGASARSRRSSTAPRSATISPAAAANGPTCNGAKTAPPGLRFAPRAITGRRRCALPMPPPAPCATSTTRRSRPSSNPAMAHVNWKYLSGNQRVHLVFRAG